ncbi:hypothetical protein CDL15_Pgr023762 [Punica granatum]|uniref:MBD domain-containing protein n=1 Tax=Punica granatum TaxID=22663 RepID=A0A218WSP6_PUNGR|nr:hypothetical protein CDL15_Pgr023762 [Punica granatum]
MMFETHPTGQYLKDLSEVEKLAAQNFMDDSLMENNRDAPLEEINNYPQEMQLMQLSAVLTQMVKESASQLKSTSEILSPDPISSYRIPDQDTNMIIASDMISDQDVDGISQTPRSSYTSPSQDTSMMSQTLLSLDKSSSHGTRMTNPNPISSYKTSDQDLLPQPPHQRKKKMPTQLMGEICTSFELPDGFDINLDELTVIASHGSRRISQFSFFERLAGWKIECKVRTNGKSDLYYTHEMSKKTFRSVKEVVNFMMFEAYPKGQYLNDLPQLGLESHTKAGESSQCKKLKSSISLKQDEEPPQGDPVKFLEESYNNLLNYFKKVQY